MTVTSKTSKRPPKKAQYASHDNPERTSKRNRQGEDEGSRAARHRQHQEAMNISYGRAEAKRLLGPEGSAVYDPLSPPDLRCRVGKAETLRLSKAFRPRVLHVYGAGPTWADALREASRSR